MLLAFGVVAGAVSGLVPPLRDEVTLTALGERREGASAEEIVLTGFTVDGKEYVSGKDLERRPATANGSGRRRSIAGALRRILASRRA